MQRDYAEEFQEKLGVAPLSSLTAAEIKPLEEDEEDNFDALL